MHSDGSCCTLFRVTVFIQVHRVPGAASVFQVDASITLYKKNSFGTFLDPHFIAYRSAQ
jgi:hypothetical protein